MVRIRLCLPLLLLGLPSVHAHDHDTHARASTPADASPRVVSLEPAARATLTRHQVEASVHGRTLRCEGVSLAALLQATGAMPDTPLRGAHLDRYVLVTTRDDYRAVFSLGELDATLGNRGVYLVDRCDDAPLDDSSGPLRLLVPDDSRAARSVRQVERITVVAAP